MLLLVCVAGCGGDDSGSTSTEGNGAQSPRGALVADTGNCNELLETALATLQPDEYLVADPTGAITVLNGWKANCETPELARVQAAMVGDQARRLLDDETLARVKSPVFDDRDATHVRTSILFHDVAEAAVGDGATDLERVENLFRFVVRNVQLVPDGDPLAGLDPFRTLLFGEGSAADRAWVFAALLRQRRIDAVVLRPDGDAEDGVARLAATRRGALRPESDRWLVGVVLDGEVRLFDPRSGLAIPSPGDSGRTPLPTPPATLAEVQGEADVLAALDLPDSPYPLDDADLADLRVEVIGHASLWAPRMAGPQRILHGPRATILVDALDDPEGRLDPNGGIVHRLTTAIDDWTPEMIDVWPYPEERMGITLDDLDADSRSAILTRSEVFGTGVGGADRDLLVGRLQQLRGVHATGAGGDETSAVAAFTSVRSRGSAEARRDADFWTAIGRIESGEADRGDALLRIYLESHPDGRFTRTARVVRAVRRAANSPERAIEELEPLPDDVPDAHGLALLERRWTRASPPEQPAETEPLEPAKPSPSPPPEAPPEPTAESND